MIEVVYIIGTFLAVYGVYCLLYRMFRTPNSLHTHIKTGGQYIVLMEGTLEHSLVTMTIYKSLDTGKVWIRPSNEFNNGRFESQGEA